MAPSTMQFRELNRMHNTVARIDDQVVPVLVVVERMLWIPCCDLLKKSTGGLVISRVAGRYNGENRKA
jgi:hypothetical protein